MRVRPLPLAKADPLTPDELTEERRQVIARLTDAPASILMGLIDFYLEVAQVQKLNVEHPEYAQTAKRRLRIVREILVKNC